ncbi:hypothetical protein [Nostoc sp.]
MAEKSQVNWNEQPLEQPTPIPIHTASCPPSTTTPLYKGQNSDGRARNQVQQAFNSEQPNSIPTQINTSPAPSTTTPLYKDQDSDGRAEIQVEQAFNLEEFMTPESLECTAESLEFLATIDYTDGVEVVYHDEYTQIPVFQPYRVALVNLFLNAL